MNWNILLMLMMMVVNTTPPYVLIILSYTMLTPIFQFTYLPILYTNYKFLTTYIKYNLNDDDL